MQALRVLPTASLGWGEVQLPAPFASVKACALVNPPATAFVSGRSNWGPLREPVQGHLWRDARRRCLQNGGYLAAAEEELYGRSSHVDEQEQQLLLKTLASTLSADLKGTCVYLIGMMGSGKTTVGKILAEALGYLFFDTDALIEQAAGATVAELFSDSETNFRDAETEVLSQLSCMGHLVVATGGGVVVRTANWGYLRHGVTVWLKVPVGALAKRVVAVGAHSRPLLGHTDMESACAYEKAHACLSRIMEERSAAYRNADAIVCLEELASNFGCEDTCHVTPTMIAIQILRELAKLLAKSKKPKFSY